MYKKSQAAMEFLMTYGWAILIVLIVLAALFLLGVFSPGGTNNCSADQPFGCVDVRIAAAGTGETSMNVGQVSGTPTFVAGSYIGTCTAAAWSGTFTPNTKNTITLTCVTGTSGNSFSGSFKISYTSAISGVSHTTNVKYSGKYE